MNPDRLTQILENLAREQPATSIHFKATEPQSASSIMRSVPLTISNNYMQTSRGHRYFDSVTSGFRQEEKSIAPLIVMAFDAPK